ncbi:MAG: sigma 54-interacting transcriptional regulator [Youngiibacter sp.]|nr:sigma 54-interacting transcriptional regulator [Youngiibacter sp.]
METNELIRLSLEAFPNYILVDDKGLIVYINKVYSELLGVDQAESIGRHVSDVIPNTRMDAILKTGAAENGSIMKFHNHNTDEDITLVCNRIPITVGNRIVGAVAVTTLNDISEVDLLSKEIERIREENRKMDVQISKMKKILNPIESIIGNSKVIIDIKKSISDYAKSNLSILITGETGVGKEVFANTIHQLSNRSMNNFVKINCAAIPHDLLESELFGYAEGAFSGANKGGKIGKFELANNGTILLDEIGEMPMPLQSKLLRVLQENELDRVGGTKSVKLNIRLICSTNGNIEELIRKKLFREDLYYRINTVTLQIPPLRARLTDIPKLCEYFTAKVNQIENTRISGVSEEVLEVLQSYDWPGNVRELEHVIYRASVLCQSGTIELKHLNFFLDKVKLESAVDSENSLKGLTSEMERKSIVEALKATGGNKSKAAKMLKIDRSLLYNKLKKYNIK